MDYLNSFLNNPYLQLVGIIGMFVTLLVCVVEFLIACIKHTYFEMGFKKILPSMYLLFMQEVVFYYRAKDPESDEYLASSGLHLPDNYNAFKVLQALKYNQERYEELMNSIWSPWYRFCIYWIDERYRDSFSTGFEYPDIEFTLKLLKEYEAIDFNFNTYWAVLRKMFVKKNLSTPLKPMKIWHVLM